MRYLKSPIKRFALSVKTSAWNVEHVGGIAHKEQYSLISKMVADAQRELFRALLMEPLLHVEIPMKAHAAINISPTYHTMVKHPSL